MKIPDLPFFVDPLTDDTTGIDFLNLGAVGERIIALGLPGVTNVTKFLRAYSIAAWTAWRFHEGLKEISARNESLPMSHGKLFRQFREKVEVLFTWCNRYQQGAIGRTRDYPATFEKLSCSFDEPALGAHNSASWFAAAAYGPSFVDPGGLGFIRSIKATFEATDRGRELALVIESLIAEHAASHGRISHLTDHVGSLRDVQALDRALNLGRATKKEKAVFRAALYPEERLGAWGDRDGHRATSIALMLAVLEGAGTVMSVEDIRRSMALGILPSGTAIEEPTTARMRQLWHMLSIRQLQRVAMERLLAWFEEQLQQLRYAPCDLAIIRARMRKALRAGDEGFASETVQTAMDAIRKRIAKAGGARQAPFERDDVNQFSLRAQIEDVDPADGKALLVHALRALLVSVAYVELLIGDEAARTLCDMGGRERVSLKTLHDFVLARTDQTVESWADDHFVQLVYGQHLRTAALRLEPGKNKFRFALDDHGLRPLVEGVNSQLGTPDRIESTLELMSECDLVVREGGQLFKAAS